VTDAARPLLAFYGDDFTGSAAVMEALASAGLRTVLFLDPPTRATLARYPGVRCVGVAGMTRAMPTDALEGVLAPAFEALRGLDPELVLYKVCSTFDSSPTTGSIGRAIDVGQQIFSSPFVPLVVASPDVGRYCAFGHLFAVAAGGIVRLDRHPTMSVHPTTPMDESDLRLHRRRQRPRPAGLMDLLALRGPDADVDARFQAVRNSVAGGRDGGQVILFDVVGDEDLRQTGRLVWENRGTRPLFMAGSQGLAHALVTHLRATGVLSTAPRRAGFSPAHPLLVVSGSCSPQTAEQIAFAIESGFAEVPLDTRALLDARDADTYRAQIAAETAGLLAGGSSVIVHSARGPVDARIGATRQGARGRVSHSNIDTASDTGRRVGEALGALLRQILAVHRPPRIMLAGGDTSGHGTRALGAEALELAGLIVPGAVLCQVHGGPAAGIELVLKGGQMGGRPLFTEVKNGSAS
jgi:uncharacterized protein YgbK (DUF1537 family)